MTFNDLSTQPHPPNSYWHGGGALFAAFDHRHWGTGEGQALGAGHYLAANPSGGEYFARYALFQKNKGFLYRVAVDQERVFLWNYDRPFLDQPANVRQALSQIFGPRDIRIGLCAGFDSLRTELGDLGAAHALLEAGINAIYTQEEHKPGHGHTLVVLDDDLLRVTGAWEVRRDATVTPVQFAAW